MNNKIFEWTGVTTAILYSLFVALNIGIEFIGFSLLLLSAVLIGIWAYRGKHKGILLLQFFYASAGVIGMIRWFWLKNEKALKNGTLIKKGEILCQKELNLEKNQKEKDKDKKRRIRVTCVLLSMARN